MNTSIKSHIIENFKEDDVLSIISAVDDSIKDEDEELLPALGVFMTFIWKRVDDDTKSKLALYIKDGIKDEINDEANKEKH